MSRIDIEQIAKEIVEDLLGKEEFYTDLDAKNIETVKSILSKHLLKKGDEKWIEKAAEQFFNEDYIYPEDEIKTEESVFVQAIKDNMPLATSVTGKDTPVNWHYCIAQIQTWIDSNILSWGELQKLVEKNPFASHTTGGDYPYRCDRKFCPWCMKTRVDTGGELKP